MKRRLNILVLRRSNTVMPRTIKDVLDALNSLGHDTKVLDLDHLDSKTIRCELSTFKPDFVMANNHTGIDSSMMEELKIPHACWFEEDPFYWLRKDSVSHYRVIFTWDRAYIPKIKEFGFKHVYFLPLGTNTRVFKEIRIEEASLEEFGCDLSFAGGSYYKSFKIIEDLLKKWANPKIREITYEAIRVQSENPLLSIYDILETLLQVHGCIPFADEEGMIMFGRILAGAATSVCRKKIVSSLDGFDINLYGDEGWNSMVNTNNIRFFGPLPYEELPKLFIASKINLNLATIPIKTSITTRPFDVLSCGGFVLSDYRRDIESLFEIDREIVCFKDEFELKEKIRYFLKYPREREEIAKRGKERVLREHTYRHRIKTLIGIMQGIFG